MYNLDDFRAAGKELEDSLHLRSVPIAFKLIDEDSIPEGCTQPSKKGSHYALCQAFSAVRRNRRSFALFKEDHWCLWPLISFRNVELDAKDVEFLGSGQFIKDREKSIEFYKNHFPMIEPDKKKAGIAIAPLASTTFIPDLVIVYCIPAQLRQLLMAAKYNDALVPEATLQTVNSCGAAVLPIINGRTDYNVAIPDPGEFERSLAWDDEMIFTVSALKLESLVDAIRGIAEKGFGYKSLAYDMKLDYDRADFYNIMFKKWGLDTGAAWTVESR
jgi:uncharacterized protein (DUF169 family)